MSTLLTVTGFILWVNFLPPLTTIIFGERFSRPLDGEKLWLDNKPIFGSHKTARGIIASIFGGIATSPLLGVSWWIAGTAALLAMTGDLTSSFVKRRLNIPSGRNIFFLDQIFESIFPAVFLKQYLPLNTLQVTTILVMFIPIAYLGSCFWNFITFRTPIENYPRIIRSTVRLREWRSCHSPLARWQFLLKLSSVLAYQVLYSWVFRLVGLEEKGKLNTLAIQVDERTFWFDTLPAHFDSFRILFLSDLHLDGLKGLTENIIALISNIEVDLCIIAGDIRMKTYGPTAPCLRQIRKLLPCIRSHHGILGVLGNHDCIEMTPDLEESGMIMLINDSMKISENGEDIWVIGVDDPHYYKVDDAATAFRKVPDQGFKIFVAHSPEAYRSAADFHPQLYLCGHTHGGQICLPGKGPIFTNSRAPRFTALGNWSYQDMAGYTSRGTGASGVPLRFNCPGEISLITLKRGIEPSPTG